MGKSQCADQSGIIAQFCNSDLKPFEEGTVHYVVFHGLFDGVK